MLYSRMEWEVEGTDEWFQSLAESQQEDVDAYVTLLMSPGPNLPHPFSSGIGASRHSHMRELRAQSDGDPIRVFYAFDPRRTAILLIGGEKRGNKRFYKEFIPIADRLYDEYLEELQREGLLDG